MKAKIKQYLINTDPFILGLIALIIIYSGTIFPILIYISYHFGQISEGWQNLIICICSLITGVIGGNLITNIIEGWQIQQRINAKIKPESMAKNQMD
jgi:membrane associated rhomboid family serine protease